MNLDQRCKPSLSIDYALTLVWGQSNQLVAIGIMLCIPSLQLSLRHPDKLVSDSAVFLVHHTLLTDLISLPLRDEVDPEVVVDAADSDTGRTGQHESGIAGASKNLHRNACDAVRGVPEAHGTSVGTALRWNPRHDEKKNLGQNEQADRNVPRLELGPSESDLAALTSDQVDTDSHGEEEHGLWVVLEIDHCE